MVPEAKIFAGRHTMHLAAQIAKQYGVPMGNVKITEFSDGEICPSFEETVRGTRVFFNSKHQPPCRQLDGVIVIV